MATPMKQSTSAAARIVAVIALIAAVVVVVVVASSAMNGSSSGGHHHRKHQAQKEAKKKQQRKTPKTYTVQTGDTLTSIAQRSGVSVSEIMALNPEVDPQILRAGETLKLK